MPFLFVPINQMVLGSFRGEELGQVAGMQNFFRQVGGSIGISSLDTLLTRFSAQHYNDIMGHVTMLAPATYQAVRQAGAIPARQVRSFDRNGRCRSSGNQNPVRPRDGSELYSQL